MSPVIWDIARAAEQPKKHLAHQVIEWSRYEKAALLVILTLTVFLYGVVAALYFHEPIRTWLGW